MKSGDVLTNVGHLLELVGLGFAAFGMWRSWNVNAQGAVFWPAWIRGAYFWVARLWGQTPRPIEIKVDSAVHAMTASAVALATGRVAGAAVDERLDILETEVDQLKATMQRLAGRQEDHERALDAAVESLRCEIADAQQTTERKLSLQTVTDLRPAAGGVALAAFGLLLQWLGSW